jgi:multiple sugar transport system substrate-binding protein
MSSEPKKVGRRTFINYIVTIIATGVIVGAATYFAVPKEAVTKTIERTVTTTVTKSLTSATVPKPSSLTIGIVAGPESKGIKAVAPLFEKEYDIKITFAEYPYDALYEKYVTTFEAGMSSFDLIMSDDVWMPKWGSEGWMTPLDVEFGLKTYENSDIPKTSYWLGSWPPPTGPVPPGEEKKSRHLYGLSIVGNMQVFVYRKDLINKPPETWDEVLSNAQKVNDPSKGIYGFVVRGMKGEPATMHFLPIMKSFGGDFFADDWRIRLTDKEVIDALKFEIELKKLSPPGSENFDAAERARAVAMGSAAQAITWPAEITDFILNPEVSKVMDKVEIVPVPGGKNLPCSAHTGNWLLCIPKFIPNDKKYWAFEFMKWILTPNVQKEYALSGGIPVLKTVQTDPELVKKYPYQSALKAAYEGSDTRIEQGLPALCYPRTPELMAIVTIVGTYINAALAGLETAESAMQKAKEELINYLKPKGYPVY